MNSAMLNVLKAVAIAFLLAVVAYLVAWYSGKIVGNFPLLLLVATAFTGVYWLIDKFLLAPQRKKTVAEVEQRYKEAQERAEKLGVQMSHSNAEQEAQELSHMPWWMDWTGGLFPVILVVFILRSFLFEPFKIPTSSMVPTLLPGDFILVNKFAYGLRMPVWHTKITEGERPKRGDIMVFRYPPDPKVDYIKRIVGVPGDVVRYENKALSVNGKKLSLETMPDYAYMEKTLQWVSTAGGQVLGQEMDQQVTVQQFTETLPADASVADAQAGQSAGVPHRVILNPMRNASPYADKPFSGGRSNCTYFDNGVECTVPAGHYFMLGDNRDNSKDSRFWGFVPEKNIVGKAVLVWMNFSDFGRIGMKP